MNATDALVLQPGALGPPWLEFFVIGRVAPKGSMSIGKTKQGNLFLRRSTKGKDGEKWEHTVGTGALYAMRQRNLSTVDCPIFSILTFVRPRPRIHFARSGEIRGAHRRSLPQMRPDVDKLCRAVGDALTGIVYRDDSLLTTVFLRKRWATCEGVLVSIWFDLSDGDFDVAPYLRAAPYVRSLVD